MVAIFRFFVVGITDYPRKREIIYALSGLKNIFRARKFGKAQKTCEKDVLEVTIGTLFELQVTVGRISFEEQLELLMHLMLILSKTKKLRKLRDSNVLHGDNKLLLKNLFFSSKWDFWRGIERRRNFFFALNVLKSCQSLQKNNVPVWYCRMFKTSRNSGLRKLFCTRYRKYY